MDDKNKVIVDSVESFKYINNIDLKINTNQESKVIESKVIESKVIDDDLIVKKHFPIKNITESRIVKLDYRIPSPPAVVKTEYIVKEYKGVPKKEESTCLIEKRISFKEENIKEPNKETIIETIIETIKEPNKETIIETIKEPNKETIKETNKETIKELNKNKRKRYQETTFVNNGLLIGGGIVGALFGAYVFSGVNSE